MSQFPKGKALFVETLTPSNLVERATWLGCSWALLETSGMSGGRVNSDDALADFAAQLRDADVEVWLWGWPMPDAVDDFVDDLKDAVAASGATGFVLDMEKAWMKGQCDAAKDLVAKLRAATDITLGLSSYGKPDNFPDYPWDELSALDFGLPQIYDSQDKYGPGFPQRCVDNWRKWFGEKPIVPTLGVNSTSAARMQVLFDNTPLDDGACSWWSFRGAISENDKASTFRNFQLPS